MNPYALLLQLPTWVTFPVGVLGLFLLVRGVWMMWQGDGSADWPTVQGLVQQMRVEHRTPARFHVGGFPIYQRVGGYEFKVKYAYELGDQVHLSDRWSFAGNAIFPDEKSAMLQAQHYREANPVTVYHHPVDHAEAVLKKGGRGSVPRHLGRSRTLVETAPFGMGDPRGTDRPAVDAGRGDPHEEDPVEAGIARAECAGAPRGIEPFGAERSGVHCGIFPHAA